MAEQVARFKPGVNVPGFATAAVLAGRFVAISAAKTASGDYSVAHCPAGAHVFGVAERDTAGTEQAATSVERRTNIVRRGAIARVLAGVDLTHGQIVMSDANGKAIPLAETGVAAKLNTGVVGNNNAITHTANEEGAEGNEITIALVDPAANSQALAVDVDNGTDIIVSLATNSSGVITSTAAQVIAAIKEDNTASGLITPANTGASSGAGVVVAVAKTNLAGGADAATGVAAGQVLGDTTHDHYAEIDLF